jgi:hypothetical protein
VLAYVWQVARGWLDRCKALSTEGAAIVVLVFVLMACCAMAT